ncbi:MAG: hypothetical protein JWM31_1518, partial [Solirubrobacterales bacterium]|nr:hypothetical protein [Solirubrobacterales bacterium]
AVAEPLDDDERPLGVRAVPAASTVPAGLLADRHAPRVVLGDFDRWAIRVLAVAAATCFLLLLFSLLKLFV